MFGAKIFSLHLFLRKQGEELFLGFLVLALLVAGWGFLGVLQDVLAKDPLVLAEPGQSEKQRISSQPRAFTGALAGQGTTGMGGPCPMILHSKTKKLFPSQLSSSFLHLGLLHHTLKSVGKM